MIGSAGEQVLDRARRLLWIVFAGIALFALTPGISRAQALYEAFIRAVETDDVDKLRAMLARGVDPNIVDTHGEPVLVVAARAGWERTVDALLAAGAFALPRNDRATYWRVAAKDFESHVAVGSGAGTYAAYWRRHPQRVYFAPSHAHSLYLETGAELGVVGLALLLVLLAPPLSSLGSRDPIRLGAACGFLAFVLHAGVDWDWEMPVVTTAALYFASVLVTKGSDAVPSGQPRGCADRTLGVGS